jgi:chemotaxis protein MotB
LGGPGEDKSSSVDGLSSAALFDKKDASSAINRRIGIIVMTKQAEQNAHATDDAAYTMSPVAPSSAAPP